MGSDRPAPTAFCANSNHERCQTGNKVRRGYIAWGADAVQPDTDFRLRGTQPNRALMREDRRPQDEPLDYFAASAPLCNARSVRIRRHSFFLSLSSVFVPNTYLFVRSNCSRTQSPIDLTRGRRPMRRSKLAKRLRATGNFRAKCSK